MQDGMRRAVPEECIGGTQPIPHRKGNLLEGLSPAQVIAGAAAAATSVLLASRLGVYGSAIGAAVSSAVTIVATQVYRRILTASARKLAGVGGAAAADGSRDATAPPHANIARTAPLYLRERAAAERARAQRKIVIASAAAALLAVVLTAGAILLTTAGQGLGTRPEPVWSPPTQAAEQVTPPQEESAKPSDSAPSAPAGGDEALEPSGDASDANAAKPDTDKPDAAEPDAEQPDTAEKPGDGTQAGGSGEAEGAESEAPAQENGGKGA